MSREEVKIKLTELIEPLIESMGFELVQLEYIVGKHGKLYLVVDQQGGISIEDCAVISRAVSDLLDTDDPITHAYTLEVSSPGLERPLTKKEHFKRFQGNKVKIKTGKEFEGNSKFCGILESAGDDGVMIIKEDQAKIKIPYELISKANLWYTKPEKNILNTKRKEVE